MIKRDEKGNIVDNPRIKDKTGQRYGRLVVKEIDLNKSSRKTFWICECDCGNIVSIRSDTLGSTNSCGCLKKEQDFKNLQATSWFDKAPSIFTLARYDATLLQS